MNRFGNFCLDISSLAVVLFILSLCYYTNFIYLFLASMFLLLLCWSLLKLAQIETEGIPSHFDSISEADSKTLWWLTSLLMPILQENFNLPLYQYAIIGAVCLLIYWKSIIFIYNPIALLLGYHYYTVSIEGKNFTLLSKQKLMNPHQDINVGQLSNNLIIVKSGEKK